MRSSSAHPLRPLSSCGDSNYFGIVIGIAIGINIVFDIDITSMPRIISIVRLAFIALMLFEVAAVPYLIQRLKNLELSQPQPAK